MLRIISVLLLVGGIALAIYGINATQSLASDISRFFTGAPTDRAIWMLIGGVVLFIVGFVGLTRSPREIA